MNQNRAPLKGTNLREKNFSGIGLSPEESFANWASITISREEETYLNDLSFTIETKYSYCNKCQKNYHIS